MADSVGRRSLTLAKGNEGQAPQLPYVEVHEVEKVFAKESGWGALLRRGERKHVLQGVSLNMYPGEILGLLGPNGAGKTTLIKILCTLIKPDGGWAKVGGYDVARRDSDVRRLIGLVNCDDRSFYWRLSARENLRFYAALYNLPAKGSERRINDLLELTNLYWAGDARLYTFSSGMKQRLAVARGLLSDPPLLFMDEMTRSLDPVSAAELRHFIKERISLDRQRTVVLATNIMAEAEYLCDRVAFIEKGQLKLELPTSQLTQVWQDNDRFLMTTSTLGGDALGVLKMIPGVVAARRADGGNGLDEIDLEVERHTEAIPEAIRALVRCNAKVWACTPRQLSLEDVFRQIFGGEPNGSG